VIDHRTPTELTLFAGSVAGYSLTDRVAAALAGGFANVTLFAPDVQRARASGMRDHELRALFEGAGLRIVNLDPLVRWLPGVEPPVDLDPGLRAFIDFEADELFEMAVALGVDLISVIALFGEPVELELATESFALMCERAATQGLRLALEPMPFGAIPDLACGWEVVRQADQPNGGLVIDAWHVFRSARSGADLELLAEIPGTRICALQLNDAPRLPETDLRDESSHRRLLPGAGDLDLDAFLDAIDRTGATPLVGPEVFSDELWDLPPAMAGAALADSTRAALTRTS
jgi:sugar phosphate isomerase/epimerase